MVWESLLPRGSCWKLEGRGGREAPPPRPAPPDTHTGGGAAELGETPRVEAETVW